MIFLKKIINCFLIFFQNLLCRNCGKFMIQNKPDQFRRFSTEKDSRCDNIRINDDPHYFFRFLTARIASAISSSFMPAVSAQADA